MRYGGVFTLPSPLSRTVVRAAIRTLLQRGEAMLVESVIRNQFSRYWRERQHTVDII